MNKKIKIGTTIIALGVGLLLINTKVYATKGKAINNATRIRKEATTNSEVVDTLDKNQEVEILSEENNWYKIEYKSKNTTATGYVRNDLLEVKKDSKNENNEDQANEELNAENNEVASQNQENDKSQENEATENNAEFSDNKPNEAEVTENTVNEDEVEIKENTSLELKNDTDVQLLPVIYSCKIGSISANTEVTITEVVGNWCHIEAEDNEGWVLSSKIANSKSVKAENQDANSDTENVEHNNENIEENNENVTTNENASTVEKNTSAENEENKEENKQNAKLYVSTVTLNLREKADTKSKIITQLNQNDQVTVVKVVDDTWTQVKINGVEGFAASKYLSNNKVKDVSSRGADEIRKAKEEEEAAKKKAEEELAAKKKAEEEAAAKKKAEEEEAAKKKAEEEAAAKKKAEEEAAAKKKAEEEAAAKKKAEEEAAAKKKAEEEAAAKKKAEEDAAKKNAETKKDEKSSSKGVTGSDIVAYAKKYLGYRYVYGTAGPKTFDCSGFTSYVYKHFGYSLSRTSGGQRSNGKKVNKSDLQPGDILCFSGHVGIYIGGNKFIHAANPKKGIIITSLSDSYYVKTYITARRIL